MNKRFTLFLSLLLAGTLIVRAQTDDSRPLYALPLANVRAFSSSSMALADNGRTIISANMLNNTISIIELPQGQNLTEIPVGNDPRSVALTRDNTRVLVANRQDGTLSVINLAEQSVQSTFDVGLLPYATVTDNDTTAYISVQGTDEIVQVDINTGRMLERIAVPDSPAGLALWGDFLYVTHLWSGELSLIYRPSGEVVRTIPTGDDISLSQALLVDTINGVAYLPQSRSNAQNTALTVQSTVFPVVNVVDLSTLIVERESRIGLNLVDRPVNMPFSAALDSVRRWLYVVNAGSDDLSIIDLNTGLVRGHVFVGANPRSVLLSRDNSVAYVHSMIDGSLTIIETRFLTVADVIPISNLTIPIDTFIGSQLFHSARDPRMSRDGWISCASCHFDGQSDGRVWQGFPGGARNTPVLYGLEDKSVYTWMGDWDELADVEWKIRELHAGSGLIDIRPNFTTADANAGLSLDLDALTAYLLTLDAPFAPQPRDSETVTRGAAVFDELDCASCHSGEARTDGQTHDVGTDGEFVTPGLNWLWQSAPYFHDGRARTVAEVFAQPGTHQLIGTVPSEDIESLIFYLLSLPVE